MRHRTPVLLILLTCAAGLFTAAFLTADRIPADGDAHLEALTNGLTTAGATVLGGVVTLAAVVWALNLESKRSTEERYRGHQVDLIREAADWLRAMNLEVGHIYGAALEASELTNGPSKTHAMNAVADRAGRFIDDGQHLYQAARLAKLVDDPEVVSTLEQADAALCRWNEIMTDGGFDISMPDSPNEMRRSSDELSDLHRVIEARLTQAIRDSWT